MEDAFKTRERALENSFFRAVDQTLVQRMREETEREDRHEKLKQATGITDDRLIEELIAAGIRPSTLVAFFLLPLARVAWADGMVDKEERQLALNTAIALGCDDESEGLRLLSHWLAHAPGDELFLIWQEHAGHIAQHISPTAQRELVNTLVRRARAIAQATGGLLGMITVSSAERAVIRQIRAAFPTSDKESP